MLYYYYQDNQSEASFFLSNMSHKHCKIFGEEHEELLETCNSSADHF